MMRLIAAICVALVSSQQHADPYASIRDAFGKMDPIPEGYVHHIDEELRRQLPGELPEISFTPNEDPFKVTILNEEDFKAKRANASRMIDGEDIFHSQVFGGTTEGHQRAWYERMLRKGLEAELRRRKKAGEPEFDIDEAIELNREEERQRLQKNEETQLEQEEEEASLLEVQESRRRTHSLRKSSHRAHRLRKSSRQKHASYFGSYRCERFKSCTACMEASDLECTDKAWKGDFKSDNKLDNKQKMPCMYKSMMSTYFVKGCKWDSKNHKCQDIKCSGKSEDILKSKKCTDDKNTAQNPLFVVDKKHCIVTSQKAKSSGTDKPSETDKSSSETQSDPDPEVHPKGEIDKERLMQEFKCEYKCQKDSLILAGGSCGVTIDMMDTPARETCALAGCETNVCKQRAEAECAAHEEEKCGAKASCVKGKCDKAIAVGSGATPAKEISDWKRIGSSILHTLIPKVRAYVCVQINVDMAAVGVPGLTVELGLMAQVGFDLATHCWNVKGEVSLGFLIGFKLFGKSIGIHIYVAGTLDLNEVPRSQAEDVSPTFKPPSGDPAYCHSLTPFSMITAYMKRAHSEVARSNALAEKIQNELENVLASWDAVGRRSFDAASKTVFPPPPAKLPMKKEDGVITVTKGPLADYIQAIPIAFSQFTKKLSKLGLFGLSRTLDNKNNIYGDDACVQCNTYKESTGRFLARKRARSIEAAEIEKEEIEKEGEHTTEIGIAKVGIDEDDKGDGKDGVQVFNLAKVIRWSTATKKSATSLFFWREIGISAANLFVRTVANIHALMTAYFADDASWDGDCLTLPAMYTLSFEEAGTLIKTRTKGTMGEADKEHKYGKTAETNPWRSFDWMNALKEKKTSIPQWLTGDPYEHGEEPSTMYPTVLCQLRETFNAGILDATEMEYRSRGMKKDLISDDWKTDKDTNWDELDAAARERAHLASKSELFAAATDPGIQKTPTSHRKRYLGSSRKQGQPIYVDPVDMMIRQTCRVKHLGKVQMRHECERTTLSTQFANAFPSLTEVIEALKELITHELRTINRCMGEELEPEHLVNDPSNTITPENSDNCAKTDKRVEYVKMRAKNIIAYYRNFMIGLGADAADFKKDAGYKEFSITMQTGTDFLTGLKNLMSRNAFLKTDPAKGLRLVFKHLKVNINRVDTPCEYKDNSVIQDPKTGDWTGTVTGGSVMKDYEKKNGKTKDKRSVCEARIRIMPQLFKGNLITLMKADQWQRFAFTKDKTTGKLNILGDVLQAIVHPNPNNEFFGDEQERREEMMEKLINEKASTKLQYPLVQYARTFSMGWASGEPGFCTPSTTWLAVSAAVAVEGSNYNSETTHKTCISARVHPPQFFVNVDRCDLGPSAVDYTVHDYDYTITIFAYLAQHDAGKGMKGLLTGEAGDFGSFAGLGSGETAWIGSIASKLKSAGPAALLQQTPIIASAFAIKAAIKAAKIVERKGYLKKVFDVIHPQAKSGGELTKWQKARQKIGQKLASFSAPALLCGAVVGQIAMTQANGGGIVRFLAMSSDAASLNTVTEEFGFNAEFVISAALTVQAHYSPIIEKPPKDDLPDVKPAVGKESPTDPISPPPAVKEDRKPIPNSETACEGRTDKVACELVENHVQKCTWNPTTSACMDKDAENEKQVGKKTVQQPEPKNAGLSDDQKTDPKNAGLSDKKKTDPKNAGLSDDKKTDSKNAGLSDKKKTDPINAGLSDKKKTDPKNAGLSDDQTPVRKKLVRKNAGLSVKKTSFMSNRDAKVDAVALAQRSELRQCLQEKTERRLEAQEGVRKVLDGSVEELDAFMQLDPVIVAKEDMMLPNGSSTLHVMVKRNVWQKQSEIKEHGAVEKTYERSYSLSTIKKLRTKLEKVLKILDKDRSRNPGKWDIGIDNLEVHFESWNRLGWQLPAVPGILGVDPVVSVELDFDLSALVKSVVDLKRGAENVARKDKCRECIARGQGFCDTRYEIDDWDPVKEDVCVDLEDGVERAEAECARRTNSCSGDDGKAKCFLTHYQDCKNIPFRLLDQNRLPDRSYGYKKWS